MELILEVTEQKSIRIDAYNETGENIGYAKVEITPHGIFFEDIKVDKLFRGQGVGKALAEKLFNKFPGPAYLKVEAYDESSLTTSDLITIYQKYGFTGPDKSGYMFKF